MILPQNKAPGAEEKFKEIAEAYEVRYGLFYVHKLSNITTYMQWTTKIVTLRLYLKKGTKSKTVNFTPIEVWMLIESNNKKMNKKNKSYLLKL